ncbi:MAG: lipopolysaccharide biosynthesis protein [Hyphomicrobiales bacterium]
MLLNTLIYTPAVLFPRLSALGVVLFGAQLLPQDQYGYFALIIVIGEVAEMSCTDWTRLALIRFGGGRDTLTGGTVKHVAILGALTTLIAGAVAVLIAKFVAAEAYLRFVECVLLYIVANSVLRYGLTVLQILDKRTLYSSFEVLRSIVYFLVSLFAMEASGEFYAAAIYGNAVTLIFGAVTVTVGMNFTKRSRATSVANLELIKFGWPLVIVSALSYVVSSLDKTMIAAIYDKASVGAYAVAFALGRQGFDVAANAINVDGFPRLVSQFRQLGPDAARAVLSQNLTLILAVALPAAGALIGSRSVLALVLLPAEYFDAMHYALPLVVVGAIALNIKNFIYDNIFHLYRNNLWQIPTLLAGAAATILTGLYALPKNVYWGAASMFAIGALTALAASIAVTLRFLEFKFPWKGLSISFAIAVLTFAGERAVDSLAISSLVKFLVMGTCGCIGIAVSVLINQRGSIGSR